MRSEANRYVDIFPKQQGDDLSVFETIVGQWETVIFFLSRVAQSMPSRALTLLETVSHYPFYSPIIIWLHNVVRHPRRNQQLLKPKDAYSASVWTRLLHIFYVRCFVL
jgi:hypothetical protein